MDKLKKFFSSPLEVISKLLETARDNVGFLLVSVLIVALILGAAYGAEYYFAKKNHTSRSSERLKVHRMTLIALLSAIGFVLMLIDFPLWFLPSFYKIDLSELPVLIAAFTLGPVAGVTTEFLKVFLNVLIQGTGTAFIGEFANFLIGCAFIVPTSVIYYAKKTKKNAFIGIAVGALTCVITGCLMNAYVLLPAYGKAFHMEIENLVAMGTEKNGMISGMFSFVIFAVAPFNLIKCVVTGAVTMLIYKKISYLLKGGEQIRAIS